MANIVFLNYFITQNIGIIESNEANTITDIITYFLLFIKNTINFTLYFIYTKAIGIPNMTTPV